MDHTELIGQAVSAKNLDRSLQGEAQSTLTAGDLSEIFGIDLVGGASSPPTAGAPPKPRTKSAKPKAKKAVVKSDAAKEGKSKGKVVKKSPKPR